MNFLRSCEPLAGEPLPDCLADPVAHCHVDILSCEIDVVHGGRHAQVDAGMHLGETAEPVHQPLRREVRRRADGEHARRLALREAGRP